MRTSNVFIKGLDPNAVSISRITPLWFKGMCYEPLAPPINLVQGYMSGAISETYFSQAYQKRVLDTLDPFELIKDLGMNAILLGNAPAGKFCHRRLVAKWLEENLGIKVPECRESTWLWPISTIRGERSRPKGQGFYRFCEEIASPISEC